MRRVILILAVAAMATPAFGQSVYVRPHVRSNGTFVQGHARTAPNSTRLDNYSTAPNINPYTGRTGTQSAFPAPRVPRYVPPLNTAPRGSQPLRKKF